MILSYICIVANIFENCKIKSIKKPFPTSSQSNREFIKQFEKDSVMEGGKRKSRKAMTLAAGQREQVQGR